MTWRQFKAWQWWRHYVDWHEVTLTHKHLMMVGAEVRRTWVARPLDVDVEDMAIRFEAEAREIPTETALQHQFAESLSRMPGPITWRIVDKQGNLLEQRTISGAAGIDEAARTLAGRLHGLAQVPGGSEEGHEGGS